MPDTTVLVTGSNGFIGKNLRLALSRMPKIKILCFDVEDDPHILDTHVLEADVIFHLAGVNRPQNVEEFSAINTGLTKTIINLLAGSERSPAIVLSSSTQATLDNPYGKSKKDAEYLLLEYSLNTGAPVYVFRLTNVFGKWSRPNYNSVVSTFCYNISHGLDITISDPAYLVELVYVDDVIAAFTDVLTGKINPSSACLSVNPTYLISLKELSERIYGFNNIRSTLLMPPGLSDELTRKLHATYLSYLEPDNFSYGLNIKTDNRGELAELIKSAQFGQMFVSRTRKGITRGNHYHDTKIEKFCVLQGEAVIRFRHILSEDVIEYPVSGGNWTVVDIPPGYTHSIKNVGEGELVTLFWANEIFDQERPDTFFCEVKYEKD